jgi:hypothetical protein
MATDVPGLSVAVAVNGEIVWAEGFGFANVGRRTPVTPVTRFRLGSVSKTLTAAGVALFYERGRIDLDASVQRYVPLYPRKPWPVTTRQLMGDIAGVHVIRGDNNDQVLGWKVERVQLNGAPARMVAHGATPMGGTAALLMFPDRRLIIAAASTVSNAEGVAPFGVKVAAAFASR